MKKLLFLFAFLFTAAFLYAQQADSTAKKSWKKMDLSNRPNDHFMIQYGGDGWAGKNDTISPSGFSRHFNFYFMYDMPFKTSPHLSIGIGAGLGSSNIFFTNTYIDLKSLSNTLQFVNDSAADHFKKYKLTTIFLEAPIEFRYAGNPMNPEKGFKFAVGVKVGTLLNAHTKGKDLETSTGATVYGPQYIQKESDNRFINSTRFAATARIGYGNFSIDGSYQLTDFIKTGAGPAINPYSIGITLSGL
jgi:hypothetical protein